MLSRRSVKLMKESSLVVGGGYSSGQVTKSLTRNDPVCCQVLAMRRVRLRTCATRTHATALAIVASKSLARRRQRPSQAKVLSTTQRRGRISNPFAASERLMISSIHDPLPLSAARSSRHSRRRRRHDETKDRARGSKRERAARRRGPACRLHAPRDPRGFLACR